MNMAAASKSLEPEVPVDDKETGVPVAEVAPAGAPAGAEASASAAGGDEDGEGDDDASGKKKRRKRGKKKAKSVPAGEIRERECREASRAAKARPG